MSRKGWIITVAVIALLGGIYAGGAAFFGNHFGLRTTVNGLPVTGKTVAEVAQSMVDQADTYELTITGQNGEVLDTITAEEMGYQVQADMQSLQEMLDSQGGALWIACAFHRTAFKSDNLVQYDEAKLEQKAEEFAAAFGDGTEPQDASLEYDDEAGKFVIVPDVTGTALDAKTVKEKILAAASVFAETLDLDSEDVYVKADLTADDPWLVGMCDSLNGMLGATITYTLGENREEVTKEMIASWLELDANGAPAVNREKASEFVRQMAEKYDTIDKPHTLVTTYGPVVDVPAGDYGWKINVDAEIDQLMADILGGQPVERDFVYSSTANSHSPSDFGNSYVEINLTAQHIYVYKDGQRIVDSAICSGDVATGDQTPLGAYKVKYLSRNATLRGEDYASPVNFWMPFNGGVGLHDAPWKTTFGGQIYRTNGSHGCINLMIPVAKTIFENISAGYPVLVYQLAGTETGTSSDPLHTAMARIFNLTDDEEVTLGSAAAIQRARATYNALSESQKAQVFNYSTLTAAEARLAQLQSEESQRQAAEQARMAEYLAAIDAQNTADAQRVSDIIAGLASITDDNALSRSSEIDSALQSYWALSAEAQAKVTNLGTLQQAQGCLTRAQQAQGAAEEAARQEEAERQAAEEAARQAQEEAERQAQEEAQRQAQEEAERQAQEEQPAPEEPQGEDTGAAE